MGMQEATEWLTMFEHEAGKEYRWFLDVFHLKSPACRGSFVTEVSVKIPRGKIRERCSIDPLIAQWYFERHGALSVEQCYRPHWFEAARRQRMRLSPESAVLIKAASWDAGDLSDSRSVKYIRKELYRICRPRKQKMYPIMPT